MATIFAINVELDEKQMETAVQHFGEKRMDSFVADMQGTVRSFLDTLAKEDEEAKSNKTTAIITPIGVFEFEDQPWQREKLWRLSAIITETRCHCSKQEGNGQSTKRQTDELPFPACQENWQKKNGERRSS